MRLEYLKRLTDCAHYPVSTLFACFAYLGVLLILLQRRHYWRDSPLALQRDQACGTELTNVMTDHVLRWWMSCA
jgi:hypothetical protein